MRIVSWWALLSSAIAPVVLIAGSLVVQMRQPASYDPIHDTLSGLTPVDALDRGILLGAPVAIGVCQVATAAGLRPVAAAGRLVLAFGGVTLAATVAFPQRAGSLTAHGLLAGTAFVAFALWPGAATLGPRARTPSRGPWATRRRVAHAAFAVLVLLTGWFSVELFFGTRAGLAERVTSTADVLWPLAMVVSCRRARHPTAAGGPAPLPLPAGPPDRS